MARMPRMARTPRMARWLADYPDPNKIMTTYAIIIANLPKICSENSYSQLQESF